MCVRCEEDGFNYIHLACGFCGVEIAFAYSVHVYDRDENGRILKRHTACIPCRNILDPKE